MMHILKLSAILRCPVARQIIADLGKPACRPALSADEACGSNFSAVNCRSRRRRMIYGAGKSVREDVGHLKRKSLLLGSASKVRFLPMQFLASSTSALRARHF